MSQNIFCSSCGSRLEAGDKFCPGCGGAVQGTTAHEITEKPGVQTPKRSTIKPFYLLLIAAVIIVPLVIYAVKSTGIFLLKDTPGISKLQSTDLFAKESKRGNTAGNIVNGGTAAQLDDWIYYGNFHDEAGFYEAGFYKIKTDGSGRTKLSSDKPYFINVVGDWIYYCTKNEKGIYRIKTDGSGRTRFLEEEACCVSVSGDWIYYSNLDDSRRIYKVRTDGSELTRLNDDKSYGINVVNDWVYYDSDGINKIRTDGSERARLIEDHPICINVVDDWVYYINKDDGDKIYKIKTDGSERSRINNDHSWFINVKDDWIYYSNSDDEHFLYKIRTDGSARSRLIDIYSDDIQIIEDWIYFHVNMFRIKTDGSDFQPVF
ncbi:DUF5050 domain-containing protein [Candidatus Contubernalis alkaliaceticus]|uniref:DUF5050 domain-containing protein n=1 Tax=Candidatus Contubernalis alkaliaceticus TaxID=338645 RepID=UPI001F4BD7B2|nr:DUF5050 domain-containing protein [Candidatus Contubernalis alkalaceticus]UNC91096.1 DUF5050 domain-containing protein [Candidatus Contubernalis alkalaceticus]